MDETRTALIKAAKSGKYAGRSWILCGVALMAGIDDVAFLAKLEALAGVAK